MPNALLQPAIDALVRARTEHRPVDDKQFTDAVSSPELAYEVQKEVAHRLAWFKTGYSRYWKSGGPSREAVLTHAPLPPDGVWASPADARAWPFNFRLIEVEIALRLGREVTAAQAAQLTHEEGAALVDAMTVSIEVVDSRWRQGVEAPTLLKLADLQSHGALVLGEWIAFAPRDWAVQTCTVQIGAQPLVERRGTHSLGNPAWLLAPWLRHATRDGQTVPAGTVVTTGTWCGMLPAAAGDLVTARFEGVGQASVQF
jgi:2-keto-4-pentenoate hydratase